MFSGVVTKVNGTGSPVDVELALVNAVEEPIEPHVDGFGTVLFYSRVHDSVCSTVVCIEGCGRLWVAEFC